jgi:Putative auto-transporter adhesin, head GIN domain
MRIFTSILALLALAATSPADAATRNFGVSGFDRVRVDGPFKVRLATGVAPFAVATGSAGALDGVALDVQGRTLVIRNARASWGGYPGEAKGPVEISIGTHELTAVWLNGSGSLAIDKASGLSFDLSVQGSGAASIAAVAVDQLKVSILGAAGVTLAGTAPRLTATVRGVAMLDASSLAVKDAAIAAEGPATVKATVTGTAKVDIRGAAAVAFAGEPACTVKAAGSATVTGCR